jgi:hypothetical protein
MRPRYLFGLLVMTVAVMAGARAFGGEWTYEERLDRSRGQIFVARSGVDLGFECGSDGPSLWVKLKPGTGQADGTEATIGFVTARTGARRLTGRPQSGTAFGHYARWTSPLGLQVAAAHVTGNQALDIARKLAEEDEATFVVEPRRPTVGLTVTPTKSETKISLSGAGTPISRFLQKCQASAAAPTTQTGWIADVRTGLPGMESQSTARIKQSRGPELVGMASPKAVGSYSGS